MANRLYEWDTWFQKDQFVLKRRTHYQCSQSSMAQQIRSAASARKIHVVLKDLGKQIMVEVKSREENHAAAC